MQMVMILRSGIDIIEIERLEATIQRFGGRFLQRVFTARELAECNGSVASLSARFAAKEATAKALGCGIGKISWRDVEIRRNPMNQPCLELLGPAQALAEELKLTNWTISLSHSRKNAIAVVFASGEVH
jgi:holo-[acyl-carrier protein] synthase